MVWQRASWCLRVRGFHAPKGPPVEVPTGHEGLPLYFRGLRGVAYLVLAPNHIPEFAHLLQHLHRNGCHYFQSNIWLRYVSLVFEEKNIDPFFFNIFFYKQNMFFFFKKTLCIPPLDFNQGEIMTPWANA